MTLLRDIVRFRGDRLFNGAVNIEWLGSDATQARAAASAFVFHGPAYHGVSQADVGVSHGHQLQDTASFARSVVRRCYAVEEQPFTMAIAGYGTGKSHLGLTLGALLSQPSGDIADGILAAIDTADRAMASEIRAILSESRQPCLVIILNGMRSFELTTELTKRIVVQVKARGLDTRPLEELRPRFAQAANLVRMAAENSDLVAKLVEACECDIDEILAGLGQQDDSIYRKVHDVLAARGIDITALGGESVRDVIDVAVREYCGADKPFRSLVVFFDEFGRYTEFATMKSHIAGSGALQDLFEGIQQNAGSACFVGFIQFELNAYVQRVAPEYRNEILRYVTRYQTANRVYLSINVETLIASLIEKKGPQYLDHWFDRGTAKGESESIAGNIGRWFPQSRNLRLWSDLEQFHSVIRKGSWPLSAYATWFLFHLAAAGKHLQERSVLALLGDAFERFQALPITTDSLWSLAPVDLWSAALQHELVTSEEGGDQGTIAHAYASVEARHGVQLSEDLKRLLRAVVIASKQGLRACDRDDAVEALAELSGLAWKAADEGVRQLQDEYNVVAWDEGFKEFDILGDAVPRVQFLAIIRQRIASTYDDAGKAALFRSRAQAYCNLLGDLECDFAERTKITTREWRFQGIAADLETLPKQIRLAAERWAGVLGVDEPRGTILYCYVEPGRDAAGVSADAAKLLKAAAKEAGVSSLPILAVLLCDEEGVLGQCLAELTVLSESLTDEERARFGSLVAAHETRTREIVQDQIESMIKRRLYITAAGDQIEAKRLTGVGTEIFRRIYGSALSFPFDGFSTARGNAADDCQELTRELLLGRLDYHAVLSKPVRVKNRAVSVLKDCWGIFLQSGSVRRRPDDRIVRSLTEKWDRLLASGERRIVLRDALQQLCAPPYGANIASAGLFLGAFVAARGEDLAIVRDGRSHSIAHWVQEGIFRGRFLDFGSLNDVALVSVGDESSEWETLLDEWEHAESHRTREACLQRAVDLGARVPLPPALTYRELRLKEQSKASIEAIEDMERQEHEAFSKMDRGLQRSDAGLMAWGGAELSRLIARMIEERPRWTDQEIDENKPELDRYRQAIIHSFADWLGRQGPEAATVDAVGAFKHKMLDLIGPNLRLLGLDEQCQDLERHTAERVRNVETVAEARDLVREVQSWLASNRDPRRFVRVAELRDLRQIGKKYAARLQGLSVRTRMAEIGEVRSELSDVLDRMKGTEEEVTKRVAGLFQSRIRCGEDLDSLLEEATALKSAFENCPNDLEDLEMMRRALQEYQTAYQQLSDEQLTWPQFRAAAFDLESKAEATVHAEDVPWPPKETIRSFATIISRRRQEKSKRWINSLKENADGIATMTAADADRLLAHTRRPPALLTDVDTKSLAKVVKSIEARLEALEFEWLVERYRKLSATMRRKFLNTISHDHGAEGSSTG